MLKAEKSLQYFSIFAIIILSLLVVDLLNERAEDAEIHYVIVDNRIILEDNETIEEIDHSEAAKVATFNIQVFGDTKMGKEEVVTELVEIFQRYDMVAVQEIKDIDQEVPYQFLDALNEYLLNQRENSTDNNNTTEVEKWMMVLSNRTGIQDDDINSQEQYAFYYRSTVFRALDNGVLYNDSTNDSFQREPLIAHFMLLNLQGEDTGTELTFINIHTKPTLAVEEMTALGEVVLWSQANRGDNVVLLGDFNGDCSYASYNELVQLPISTENFTWLIPDNADTTVGDSRCAYDRIVSTGDLDGRLTGQWGVDEEISSSDVSDHRPVWFLISRL
jgi:endonuclease/exonuclease/phosphatase family metal-dependent hydrolase